MNRLAHSLTESRLQWENLATMRYGERFRKHRRLVSQVLNSQAIPAYREIQMNGTKKLLKDLRSNPDKFDQLTLRYAHPVTFFFSSLKLLCVEQRTLPFSE